MRFLGVDLGSKRIGLAISDAEGEIAFPAGTLASRGRKRDLRALCELIAEREIGRAVVGLPIHMDGRRGPEAEAATRFAADLAVAAHIPVDTLDERWTSVEAERLLEVGPERGAKTKKGKQTRTKQRARGTVDELAASIILRTFLARLAVDSASSDEGSSDGSERSAEER